MSGMMMTVVVLLVVLLLLQIMLMINTDMGIPVFIIIIIIIIYTILPPSLQYHYSYNRRTDAGDAHDKASGDDDGVVLTIVMVS